MPSVIELQQSSLYINYTRGDLRDMLGDRSFMIFGTDPGEQFFIVHTKVHCKKVSSKDFAKILPPFPPLLKQ